MQMDVSAAIAQEVLAQIQRRNKLSAGFQEIVGDYQRVLQRSKEQAVRQRPALVPSHKAVQMLHLCVGGPKRAFRDVYTLLI